MAHMTSIELCDELAARLDQLAASLDRPRSWVIEQAIVRYVEEEALQAAAITEALEAYERGEDEPRPHEEVMARLEARIRAKVGDAPPVA
jgi:predicted transcriptional regulator